MGNTAAQPLMRYLRRQFLRPLSRRILWHNGERCAARYLIRHGYRILARNWRRGRHEIDLVAYKNRTLVCVEVKTRRKDVVSKFPGVSAMHREKFKSLLHAIACYAGAEAAKMRELRVRGCRVELVEIVSHNPWCAALNLGLRVSTHFVVSAPRKG